jgi:hypothetical protein
MGFFSKLKKVFNPGGAILSSYIGDGKDYRDPFEYMMKGGAQAKKNQQAQLDAQAAQRQGMARAPYTPAPGGVTSYPSLRLGGSTGGYNYTNNPFSFAPPSGGGGQGMGMSGPQQMQMGPPLSSGPPGGSMPPAGAPPQGQPTMQNPVAPQLIQAAMLRGGRRPG